MKCNLDLIDDGKLEIQKIMLYEFNKNIMD